MHVYYPYFYLTFKSLGTAGDWAKLYVCNDVHTHHEMRIPAAKCTLQEERIFVSRLQKKVRRFMEISALVLNPLCKRKAVCLLLLQKT